MGGIWLMLLAATLGGLVQSAAGFGSALVAIPLLMQVVDARTATPIQALLSLVISTTVLWRNWQSLDFSHARNLILASVPGIPLGIFLLKNLPERWIHLALGLLLVGYSVWAVFFDPRARKAEQVAGDSLPSAINAGHGGIGTWITGFCSGMLGGAYNTSGPPLVLYASLKRWPTPQFKSILAAYFVFEGVMLVIFHSVIGTLTGEVIGYFVRLFPALIAGILLGFLVEKKIPKERFGKIVLALLFVLGLKMLWH